MYSAKPEYIVPTYGVYVLDADIYDFRSVQIGGTLPVGELENKKTVLYVKCTNNDGTKCYVKIDFDPAMKAIIITSGVRELLENGISGGIISVYTQTCNAPFDPAGVPEGSNFLFQAGGGIIMTEEVTEQLNYTRTPFTIEESLSPNATPFDFIS